MGSGSSKPSSTPHQHVFSSDSPVRFSPELVNSLQASPENDRTRAADLEAHIHSRVQAELQRLDSETSQAIKDIEERISSSAIENPSAPPAPGATDQAFLTSTPQTASLSRESIQKEITHLKTKLQSRKVREDVANDRGVEQAQKKLVTCLRVNDRRPLDCWKEVEEFKTEVGRLERRFLGKVLE